MPNLTAQLIVRLLDGVSGPARKAAASLQHLKSTAFANINLANLQRDTRRYMRGVTDQARTASTWVAGASGIGLYKIHDDVYKFALATNKLRAANPDVTAAQIAEIVNLSREVARGSLFDPHVVMDAANNLARADVSIDAIAGSLKPLANAAMAAQVPISELADDFVKLASGFGLPMKTRDEARETFGYLADLAQYVAQKAPGSFNDFVQAMKYVGPTVQSLGVDIQWLAGAYIMLDKAGIRNAEAGTALRSLFTKIIQPTGEGRQVEAQLGMDPSMYTKRGRVNADQLVSGLAARFGKDFSRLAPELQRVLQSQGTDVEIQKGIFSVLEGAWGKMGPQDAGKLNKAITGFLSQATTGIDPNAFLEEAMKRGMTFGQLLKRIEPRQATRLANLIKTNLGSDGEFDKMMNTPLSQMEGFRRGLADEAAQKMMVGYVGSIQKLKVAWQDFITTLDKAGVIDKVASGLKSLGDSLSAMFQGTASATQWGVGLAALSPLLLPLVRVFQLLGGGFALGLIAKGFLALAAGIAAVVGAPVWLVAAAIAAVGAAIAASVIYWDKIKEWAVALGEFTAKLATLGVQLAQNIGSAIVSQAASLYEAGVALMDRLWDGIKAGVAKIISGAASIGSSVAGAIRGAVGGSGAPAAPAQGAGPPGRAYGGNVTRGRAYIVGERRAELFVPGQSGTIYPNTNLGGSGQQLVMSPSFHFSGQVNAAEVEERIRRVLRDEVRQLFRGIQSDTGVVFS